MNLRKLVSECEADLRAANGHTGRARLRQVPLASVSRPLALPFANLCRRAGLVALALKVLTPTQQSARNPATPAESAEYAACLQRIGATREAATLLSTIDAGLAPEAKLFAAFCCFNQWRYADAIPHLETYLELIHGGDEYQILVGKTNLAAALVATGQLEAAEKILASNIAVAKRLQVRRMLGNAYELRAQLHLQRQDLYHLNEDLHLAEACLSEEGGFESMFVVKWRAVSAALFTNDRVPLEHFRITCMQNGDWENVRDADRYLLKVHHDGERFHHLVFGSPNLVFREQVYTYLGRRPTIEVFRRGGADQFIDAREAAFNGRPFLEAGQKAHLLLILLAREFYKPLSFGELFLDLYPDEKFNIFSSPGRLHQLFHRLRASTRTENIPLEITSSRTGYRLSPVGDASILVPLEARLSTSNERQLALLGKAFENALPFSSRDAMKVLCLSETSLRRLLNWAMTEGTIQRTGQGYHTRYWVNSLARAA